MIFTCAVQFRSLPWTRLFCSMSANFCWHWKWFSLLLKLWWVSRIKQPLVDPSKVCTGLLSCLIHNSHWKRLHEMGSSLNWAVEVQLCVWISHWSCSKWNIKLIELNIIYLKTGYKLGMSRELSLPALANSSNQNYTLLKHFSST